MRLTPTEQRFYDLLSDGAIHLRAELTALLWDEQTADPRTVISSHLCNMRPKLNRRGQDVMVRGVNGEMTYRLVRLVTPGE